jgi:dUTP pyrophosphatase
MATLLSYLYNFIDHNTKLKICLLNTDAQVPLKAEPGSAGYDIHSSVDLTISPNNRDCVPTGVSLEIDKQHYVRVAPRSGLSVKKSIDIGAGVVDSSYRGEVKVVVINNGNSPFEIKKGDRIAQLIIERCANPKVEVVKELSSTERGSGGWGSTGN